MKKQTYCMLAVVALLALSTMAFGEDVVNITGLTTGSEETAKKLGTIKKGQELGLSVLTFIVGPLLGLVTCYKGWGIISDSDNPKGKKVGGFVFACGIGFFAMGKIVSEVLKFFSES